jgi:hypothetical protein
LGIRGLPFWILRGVCLLHDPVLDKGGTWKCLWNTIKIKVSGYYLADEISVTYRGVMICKRNPG